MWFGGRLAKLMSMMWMDRAGGVASRAIRIRAFPASLIGSISAIAPLEIGSNLMPSVPAELAHSTLRLPIEPFKLGSPCTTLADHF